MLTSRETIRPGDLSALATPEASRKQKELLIRDGKERHYFFNDHAFHIRLPHQHLLSSLYPRSLAHLAPQTHHCIWHRSLAAASGIGSPKEAAGTVSRWRARASAGRYMLEFASRRANVYACFSHFTWNHEIAGPMQLTSPSSKSRSPSGE
ncbi:unnamed protein product [Mycena citricolor]|uniref:Uncharacterized protein n=1 Tax=Mycena citricolor TaxID=2018698 RepID=A0AAD2HFN3_9AGAR|nr:unnamed protein product [Mycena citricolor]CAK5283005.1 unnamed protein product [Mycena citricolor]